MGRQIIDGIEIDDFDRLPSGMWIVRRSSASDVYQPVRMLGDGEKVHEIKQGDDFSRHDHIVWVSGYPNNSYVVA